MAKSQKKPAKRVFFVRRNIDDVSAFRNTTTDRNKLCDYYEGEFFGSAGADEGVCDGMSRAFVLGWESGREQRQEAVECFEKAREAGRKSAEARESKIGTSRPNRGLGNSTKARTSGRTGFRDSEQDSEHPSDTGSECGDEGPEERGNGSSEGGFPEQDSEHPSEFLNKVLNHPAPTTQQPEARMGGLKMTLSPNARARTSDKQNEQQTDLDENTRSPFLDMYRGGFPGSRKVSDLPSPKPNRSYLPGELAH